MNELKILLDTVCIMNYDKNCGDCPLRNGRFKAITKDNKYNVKLKKIAKEFLKDKIYFLYQDKQDEKAIYLTNKKVIEMDTID
ncbi:hypothetical protein BJV85_002834 [Clostridium acetobutylicum]|uniref:Uncharacterized protein n=1 Tax=Clostridium acetobutylicum (strain ATCC 824 / DSM 792 / JCM 1419 / IAM 19013 / LMG 5710 / NBRC 13948 / NRRL B-527 / VKM B-1787 / 2291 / W) TaxID=272562 RepID=Q97JV8_CLOAB|nr:MULTISPECIES: hypothetical protein [Clostridium]AAK79137.1 Hypothetical protein CA_C1165 [Clostridium acetobutylicum ATCC 824]ADZ20215.1 Conserved hypothetical protein [Clostridium acetobutylicum EA 2018]AEI31673.1 hypothetical protein SMB_G1185 [Clostridium acetobutylicum DSM 1731]AWV81610.1 hypothetical protein DK921_16230 [Clostridium acetobutylicum]MBC2393253.1 hypothetical protein [Clostridium acetobutylicum]